jgi:hypothetical protein
MEYCGLLEVFAAGYSRKITVLSVSMSVSADSNYEQMHPIVLIIKMILQQIAESYFV